MVSEILKNNEKWSDSITKNDPEFFKKHSEGQNPGYLWIGSVDSRIPPSQVCGLAPGDMLIHTNIANQLNPADLNGGSVLRFGACVLKVRHIIVCGHYGCGGVAAAAGNSSLGSIDPWLHGIRETVFENRDILSSCGSQDEKLKKLSELNVAKQVKNVVHSPAVQQAWQNGQNLSVHGLIYDLASGRLKDLGLSVSGPEEIHGSFRIEG